MARILLIDDDEAVRAMLARLLTTCGYTVVEARNGKEGLELFPHAHFDLVITDIVMPEKEGYEVLMELRKKQPPVKVFAMSGGGRQTPGNYLHAARLLGAVRVFSKPFSNEVLMTAIKEVLSESGTPVPSPPLIAPAS